MDVRPIQQFTDLKAHTKIRLLRFQQYRIIVKLKLTYVYYRCGVITTLRKLAVRASNYENINYQKIIHTGIVHLNNFE